MISLDTAFDAGRGGDDKDWDASGIWEVSFYSNINIQKDEDAKSFYEDLPNLRDFVPASFFSKFPLPETTGTDSTAKEVQVEIVEEELKEEEEETSTDVDGDADDSTPSSSNMENLLIRLPLALEKSSIDQVAVCFIIV